MFYYNDRFISNIVVKPSTQYLNYFYAPDLYLKYLNFENIHILSSVKTRNKKSIDLHIFPLMLVPHGVTELNNIILYMFVINIHYFNFFSMPA